MCQGGDRRASDFRGAVRRVCDRNAVGQGGVVCMGLANTCSMFG